MFGECHAHIMMNGYDYRAAVRLHKDAVNTQHIRDCFAACRDAGISFIRDGGDAYGVSARARQIAPAYGIDYRTPIFAIHQKGHYGGIVGRAFADLDEYTVLVEEAIDCGADFIKIMVSGIMDFDQYGVLTEPSLPADRIRDMIRIAHAHDMAVMVHANGAPGVLAAVQAGADSIEHGNYIDEDCLAAMKEHDTLWVPTYVTIRNLIGCGRFPDEILHRIACSARQHIRRAYTLGVQLALGSDAGAYRVPHARGIQDEAACLTAILRDAIPASDRETPSPRDLSAYFLQGETRIKHTFCRNHENMYPPFL